MKRNTIFYIVLALAVAVSAWSADIIWHRDVDSAWASARQRDVILMVDVYTEWCGWCGELDKHVFTDSAVISFSNKLVNLKVDAEDGSAGEALADRYGVHSFPTILFLKPDGTEVDRILGYLRAERFFEEMKRIFEGRNTFLSLKEVVESKPADPDIVITLAQKYFDRNMAKKADLILSRYLEGATEKSSEKYQLANMLFVQAKLMQENIQETESAAAKFREDFPSSKFDPQAILFLIITNAEVGNLGNAKALLKELEQKYPQQKRLIAIGNQVIIRKQ